MYYRCDSGNESDIHPHLSSGNVSPACSDYGGSRADPDSTSDTLTRKCSRDSALGSTDVERSESDCQSPIAESNEFINHEQTTPTVKVWPVDKTIYSINTTRYPYDSLLEAAESQERTIPLLESLTIKMHDRVNSVDSQDWLEDSETLSDVSQPSVCDTLRRQSSEEVIKVATTIQRQISDSSVDSRCSTSPSSMHMLGEPLGMRPSVDSITSLDNYFAQVSTEESFDAPLHE